MKSRALPLAPTPREVNEFVDFPDIPRNLRNVIGVRKLYNRCTGTTTSFSTRGMITLLLSVK